MSVLFISLPVALVLAIVAVVAFVRAVRTGQFEDLDTPPIRVLFDDAEASESSESAFGSTSKPCPRDTNVKAAHEEFRGRLDPVTPQDLVNHGESDNRAEGRAVRSQD